MSWHRPTTPEGPLTTRKRATMAGATFTLLLAFGIGTLFLMRRVSSKAEPWLERLGAMFFAGAGAVGATGWAGDAMRTITDAVLGAGDQLGAAVFGVTVTWILIAVLGIAWVGAFLPRRWFGWNYPDWLAISGLFLPSLLVAVPGVLGSLLRSGIELAGNGAIFIVGQATGIGA